MFSPVWFVALLYTLKILLHVEIPDVLLGIAWLLVVLWPLYGWLVARTQPPAA